MTLDQRILKAEAELKIAWRNGEDERAAELVVEVESLMDRRARYDALAAIVPVGGYVDSDF